MRCFHLPPEKCRGDLLRLEGREAHHALNVLRLKPGDAVTVLDGVGGRFACEVNQIARNALTLAIKEKQTLPAPPCSITLFVGLPKGGLIEDIIQKAVELGSGRIMPLLTERVVVQIGKDSSLARRNKWQQTAIEAMKQCGTGWLPTIEEPTKISQALAQPAELELALVGSLQEDRRRPHELFEIFLAKHGRLPKRVGIWIGPEGDFTTEELKQIRESGAQPITLGSQILRVETAAICCLSIVNHELQRNGDDAQPTLKSQTHHGPAGTSVTR